MFSRKYKKNYPNIVPVTPSYLELCVVSAAMKCFFLLSLDKVLVSHNHKTELEKSLTFGM